MSERRTVVKRAPGKLYIAGEYAVVEPGNTAILVAVDRYITVTVSDPHGPDAPAGTGDVVLSSDLASRAVRLRWQEGRLTGGDGGATYVVAAIETVVALLAERGLPVPALDVSITSTLHEDGRKYGLGSSGAVTVATVAAVASYCGLELSADARFRLALLATSRIAPKGSGGDLAASTWGGWIAYSAPDRASVLDLVRDHGIEETLRTPWPGCAVRQLPPPSGLGLEVGWTGSPASTTSLVSSLHGRTWRGSPSHKKFVETTADFVHAAVDALDAGDGDGLLHQIRRARQELARLDDEVRLGIFTRPLRALCSAAEAAGGVGKPSGAGGGDCGVALLDASAPDRIALVHQRWAASGVQPLPVRPAPEGN